MTSIPVGQHANTFENLGWPPTTVERSPLTKINDMESLRSFPITGNLSVIYLEGHSAAGDGGQGVFRWAEGSEPGTYVDNGGTIIVPTGGDGSAAWVRELETGEVTPEMFGAVVDGVTDDSFSIYRAWGSGFPVRMTSGRSYLASSLADYTFDQNVLISSDPENPATLIGEGSADIIVGDGCEEVSVSGVRFKAFNRGIYRRVPEPSAPASEPIKYLRVTDCKFTDCIESAVRLQCKVSAAHILNNTIDGIGRGGAGRAYGIYVGSNYNTGSSADEMERYIIGHNIISNVTSTGPGETFGILAYGRELHIFHNALKNVYSVDGATSASGIYTKSRYSLIVNNTVRDCGNGVGSAIRMKGSGRSTPDEEASPYAWGNIASHNTITYSDDYPYNASGIGSFLDDTLITQNYIEGATGGVVYSASSDKSIGIDISNNYFLNCRRKDSEPTSVIMAGNVNYATDGLKIHGNLVKVTIDADENLNLSHRGLWVVGNHNNLSIKDNIFDLNIFASKGINTAEIFSNTSTTQVNGAVISGNNFMVRGASENAALRVIGNNVNNLLMTGNTALGYAGAYRIRYEVNAPGGYQIIQGNPGLRTENSGSGTISASATSVNIAHGVYPAVPVSAVQLTLTSAPHGCGSIWVDSTTGSQIVVKCEAAPSDAVTFSWQVVPHNVQTLGSS